LAFRTAWNWRSTPFITICTSCRKPGGNTWLMLG
jgi:hypothetical protein